MKPVVFFIINSLAGGGAERIMARLLSFSEPRTRQYDVHLVLLDDEPSAYAAPSFVTVHQLDTSRSLLRGALGLMRVVRAYRPVAMLSFLTRSNLLAVLVGRLAKVRVVISERVNTSSHHPRSLGGRISRLLTRLFYPRADMVIAVSAGIADDLQHNYGVPAKRLVVIPNPIDAAAIRRQAEEPSPLPVAAPYFVAMGRLVPNKNFVLLIEAFARSGVDGELIILGEGPLREELLQFAASQGVADRVRMPGFLANPFSVIGRARAYVLASNGEGFPNGLVEAMSIGVPVISTNCASGPSEILDEVDDLAIDGVHAAKYGVLVPVNRVEAMAEALVALTDPGEAERLARLALEGARRYDLMGSVDAYWSNVLDDAQRSSSRVVDER